MRRIVIGGLIAAIIVAIILGGCAAPSKPSASPTKPAPVPTSTPDAKSPTTATSKPIKFHAVTLMAPTNEVVKFVKILADRVNKKTNGALTIDVIGGPEAIPRNNQAEALRNGVVDMAAIAAGDYAAMVPAINAWVATQVPSIIEERKRGFYEFMAPLHAQAGLYLLGSSMANQPRLLVFKSAVQGRDDLKGLKVRVPATYRDYITKLDMVALNLPLEEVYTSMERGLVQGAHNTLSDILDTSLYEVAKYWIEPGLNVGRMPILVNLNSWNKLSPELQDALKSAMVELEPEIVDSFSKYATGAFKTMTDNGMKPITFSKADAQWLLDMYYEPRWEETKAKISTDVYNRLRELLKP